MRRAGSVGIRGVVAGGAPTETPDIQQKALPLFDLQKWLAALCLGMIQNKLVKVNKEKKRSGFFLTIS